MSTTPTSPLYYFQYPRGVDEDVVAPEPQHPVAAPPKESGSRGIERVPLPRGIDLDYQPCLDADEVGDERPHRTMATELCIIERAVTQMEPHQVLRIGCLRAQAIGGSMLCLLAHPRAPLRVAQVLNSGRCSAIGKSRESRSGQSAR